MDILGRVIERVPRSMLSVMVSARKRSRAFRACSEWVADGLRDRDVRIRDGVAKGLRFRAGRSNVAYMIGASGNEPDVEAAITYLLRPEMTFYDVGAHYGYLSMVAARIVGSNGKVVSAEPLVENVRLLEHNVRLNHLANVTVLPVAIGATDGEADFLASDDPSCGKLAEVEQTSGSRACVVRATVKRLDSITRDFGVRPPDIIKIDVEGSEAAVLSGGVMTLGRFQPVLLIELHNTNRTVAPLLEKYGYVSCLLGTAIPAERAFGNVHIVAVPRDRDTSERILAHLTQPRFQRCERCLNAKGTDGFGVDFATGNLDRI